MKHEPATTVPPSAPPSASLGAETRGRIAALKTLYPSVRSALLPALKLAQEELGWLPETAVAEVAKCVRYCEEALA